MLLIDYSYFPWSAEMIRWKLFDSGFLPAGYLPAPCCDSDCWSSSGKTDAKVRKISKLFKNIARKSIKKVNILLAGIRKNLKKNSLTLDT